MEIPGVRRSGTFGKFVENVRRGDSNLETRLRCKTTLVDVTECTCRDTGILMPHYKRFVDPKFLFVTFSSSSSLL